MRRKATQKKSTTRVPANIVIEPQESSKPNLRIVAADELVFVKPAANRHRSQLVQSFLEFSDNLDAEIAKLWEL